MLEWVLNIFNRDSTKRPKKFKELVNGDTVYVLYEHGNRFCKGTYKYDPIVERSYVEMKAQRLSLSTKEFDEELSIMVDDNYGIFLFTDYDEFMKWVMYRHRIPVERRMSAKKIRTISLYKDIIELNHII